MQCTVKTWGEFDGIMIKNCFRKAGIVKEQVEDIMEHNRYYWWLEEISTEPLQNYMDLYINVMTSEVMDIDDIVDSHVQENLSDEEELKK
jgi:hypothetical protein